MFVKVTTSGPRRHLQLVESYRDEAGRVKKRTVATLGRLDQLTGELDSVIDGLLKVSGREPVGAKTGAAPTAASVASVSGTKARFCHAVCKARLGKIIPVDMKEELFSYAIDEAALRLAELMDGKLLVATNVQDMAPDKVIERYKSLADIERGFKVLKSELEIGPVYHRLPERIRAHASICFMALILHRVMRMHLRAENTGITPERALQSLRRIQHHRVSINGAAPLTGVTAMTAEHSEMLKTLKVKTPSQSQQLSLL